MFTFSFNHLQQLRSQPIALNELLDILNLQGLEVKKVAPWQHDTAITIEVKANRAFCLSYLGLLREIAAFKGESAPDLFKNLPALTFDNLHFPLKIEVEAKSACPYFAAILVEDVNNAVQTPEKIANALLAVGIHLVNPVVDILNYMMLDTGQPLHCYDAEKLQNGLSVRVNKHLKNIQTLNDTELTLPRGPITICDDKAVLAVAGIIGTQTAAVTAHTKRVLIECASFNSTAIRIASRALKISTPSAFRFERGVDASQIKQVLARCVQAILQCVGGRLVPAAYYVGKEEKKSARIVMSTKKINSVLGIDLSPDDIIACLRRYFFVAESTKRGIETEVPAFRLDIKSEIDLVGEIARIYGYHRITPTLPRLPLSFTPNILREKSHKIRSVLVGLGFYEVMNYSFIPAQALNVLRVPVDHPMANQVVLQNPLSQDYALMRSTLIYSLMQSMAFNYSIGNKALALFEIGRAYFQDLGSDTGHQEQDLVGLLFTGIHLARGFGLVKDLSYDFYDISNVLVLMLQALGVTCHLEKMTMPFLLPEASFAIVVAENVVGFCGQIDAQIWPNIPNGKLILSDAFCIEIDLNKIPVVRKTLNTRTVFPAVVREYNFWIDKNKSVSEVIRPIEEMDSLIQSVQLKDVYEGKGLPADKKAVLITVKYRHPEKTLTTEEVTAMETQFLKRLGAAGVSLGTLCR